MPELPEVETIRLGLEKHVIGQKIVQTEGRPGRLFRNNPFGLNSVETELNGKVVTGIERRGKYLWMTLSSTQAITPPRLGDNVLVVHLGMSGQVRVCQEGYDEPLAKNEHLRITFADTQLRFLDPRTFGHLTISALQSGARADRLEIENSKWNENRLIPLALEHIGPDPFEEGWPINQVIAKARRSGRRVKTLLLDQGLVSGIGNIYADEGLYRAHISGTKTGRSLSEEQWKEVLEGCTAAMGEALAVGGTSFDSLYVDIDGNPGYFSRSLNVYGRVGQRCIYCEQIIERTVLDGRSHFYCPGCQQIEYLT